MNDLTPPSAPAQRSPEWQSLMETLTRARVMIVDDEPIMIDVVQAFLEDAGYANFLTTEDSRQALDLMLHERPDVLLLDLLMPGKSGFELLNEIRAEPRLRYMPVIVLTAASDADTKLQALELGATDFLAKPVDPSELTLRLRNALAFKAYQDQLAYNDALTGLPNRQRFLDRLDWALSLARRQNRHCGLLHVGLDRFRQINDTLGHDAGDEVLREVARRLTHVLRESDAVALLDLREEQVELARLGGDEFVVLLAELRHVDDASLVARRLLDAIRAPFHIAGHELYLTLSIGVAVYPQDGNEPAELLASMDAALAQAKGMGRDAFAYRSQEANARTTARLKLETALRKALEREELSLHYQPKVIAADGRIVGVEALVRWNSLDLGFVSPGEFIPLAEETGLILQIGEFVMRRACEDAARWQREGHGVAVSVNVSSLQFSRSDMPTTIAAALNTSGLDAGQLVVELTESLLMENAQANIDLLHRIKAQGVRLSMDDFGTGYSSLAYLKQFPLDELKIDRAFVMGLPDDRGSMAIVGAVIAMAQGLGLKVTAEGVEQPAQRDFLVAQGCDLIQGYLFSRPLPLKDFETLLASRQPCQPKPV